MQIGLTDITNPNILELLISCETVTIKRPSQILYLQVQMIMLFMIRALKNDFLAFVNYVLNLCVRPNLIFLKCV